jgi:hypothetical protein
VDPGLAPIFAQRDRPYFSAYSTVEVAVAPPGHGGVGEVSAARPIPDEILAGLSPLIHEHLNFSGRYLFNVPVLDRPLRDPDTPEDEDT